MAEPKQWTGGERVRISGRIAAPRDDGHGDELRGETGEVIGGDAAYKATDGERRVTIMLDADSSIVSVPERALKNESRFRRAIFAFRAAREALRPEGE